jgi:hypothetical protein
MTDEWVGIFLVGVLAGVLIMIGMSIALDPRGEFINDLGQSICEHEYNKDFDYYNGVLHCKDKPIQLTDNYAGIQVAFVEKT